jgi:hypothetical protein
MEYEIKIKKHTHELTHAHPHTRARTHTHTNTHVHTQSIIVSQPIAISLLHIKKIRYIETRMPHLYRWSFFVLLFQLLTNDAIAAIASSSGHT